MHLWEANHDYYCSERNYFCNSEDQPLMHYKSWAEHFNEEGSLDVHYNLLFRWDWSEDEENPFNGDIYYRNALLKLFYMGQRQGLYRWVTVEVCRADEEAVIKFLQPKLDHLKKLWLPLE